MVTPVSDSDNLLGLFSALNENINTLRLEITENVNALRADTLAAMDNHEKKELLEIHKLRDDIDSLNVWKSRIMVVLAVLLALGLVQFKDSGALSTILSSI
jgi:hypothetical protein